MCSNFFLVKKKFDDRPEKYHNNFFISNFFHFLEVFEDESLGNLLNSNERQLHKNNDTNTTFKHNFGQNRTCNGSGHGCVWIPGVMSARCVPKLFHYTKQAALSQNPNFAIVDINLRFSRNQKPKNPFLGFPWTKKRKLVSSVLKGESIIYGALNGWIGSTPKMNMNLIVAIKVLNEPMSSPMDLMYTDLLE